MDSVIGATLSISTRLVIAFLILVVGYILALVMRRVAQRLVDRPHVASALGPSMARLLKSAVYYLLLALAAGLGLIVLGVPATTILAVAALLVLVLAVALHQSVANLAATVNFLIFQPFTRGELVETMGWLGTVREILLFNTVLLLNDQRLVTLLRYYESELVVENTGHVVEVPIPPGVHDTVKIAGDRYTLTQYHFHAPSEHAVNSRLADVEAHFVHRNDQGATVVVGVFYRLGRRPNPLLERVLLAAPMTAGEEVTAGAASPTELFCDLEGVSDGHGRARLDAFYTYSGSLTTPGCTENVRWFVLTDGGQVSPAALTRFHQVISLFPNYGSYPNNNRPVQSLNGRVIEQRSSGGDNG